MSDQSLASQTAEWIVTQLAAIEWFTAAKGGDAQLYRGSLKPDSSPALAEVTNDLLGTMRKVAARVVFNGHQPIDLEEGQLRYEANYSVLLAVKSERPGEALWGETVNDPPVLRPGLCLLRDLIRTALHDKVPAKSANGFHADRSILGGLSLLFDRRDAMLFQVDVIVIESPTA